VKIKIYHKVSENGVTSCCFIFDVVAVSYMLEGIAVPARFL